MLVFEDLHWADEALLAFLEHLADLAEGVPLLLVGTARPELYERHPHYADGMRNVNTINLAPLTPEETARLCRGCWRRRCCRSRCSSRSSTAPAATRSYAEEFVRLLRDRDLLERTGSSWQLRDGAEVPFPDSVQALIAARLDTLEPEAKSLLADAAVIGKVFWAGAVDAMGDRDAGTVIGDVAGAVAQGAGQTLKAVVDGRGGGVRVLARARPRRRLQPAATGIPRHPPCCCRHVDRVASIRPGRGSRRRARLPLHQRTGPRPGMRETPTRHAELEAPALRFLCLAGERALGLDTAAALASFERALTLTPEGHPAAGRGADPLR